MASVTVLVGDSWAFRFARNEEAAAMLRREIVVLSRLAPGVPVPVPSIEDAAESTTTGLPFV